MALYDYKILKIDEKVLDVPIEFQLSSEEFEGRPGSILFSQQTSIPQFDPKKSMVIECDGYHYDIDVFGWTNLGPVPNYESI